MVTDDDDDDTSEEEVVENVHARRKRERGRMAFMLLLRRLCALVALGLLLLQQPYMASRSRTPGVNKAKVSANGREGGMHRCGRACAGICDGARHPLFARV